MYGCRGGKGLFIYRAHKSSLWSDFIQVIRECVIDLNSLAAKQALPETLSKELRSLLIASTHRIAKARDVASKYLNRLISSFPSLTCDPPLVFAVLETLTLLRRACDNEFLNEVDLSLFDVYAYG